MQAMQYKIGLPADYQMEIIKERVKENGHKTDNFDGLLFKAYLITEKSSGNLANSYCPLYIWKDTEGMNKFIFGGFYDNIINSFGWQQIDIGITASVELKDTFLESSYVVAEYFEIEPQATLSTLNFKHTMTAAELGKVVIYNPAKWKYVVFTFFEEAPLITGPNKNVYTILHLSMG